MRREMYKKVMVESKAEVLTNHVESKYEIFHKNNGDIKIILVCDHEGGRMSLTTHRERDEFKFKGSMHEMVRAVAQLMLVAADICKNTNTARRMGK